MGLQYKLLFLLCSLVLGQSLPFEFPYNTSVPTRFNISVDRSLIEEAVTKAKLYLPPIDLQNATSSNWLEGPPRANMTVLTTYWANEYNWSDTEAEINSQFAHYALTVRAGTGYDAPVPLHFVHERSTADNAIPLLLLHGWPSTYLGWEDVIGPLVSPSSFANQSYHIVAPDMPGLGFSPAAIRSGLNATELAIVFDNLMQALEYSRYGVVSTDLGWWVGMWMAKVVPNSLIGHYSDFVLLEPDESDLARVQNGIVTPEELRYLTAVSSWVANHTAYSTAHQQAPLLIAQVLTHSPVGFAGWVWHLCYAVSDGYAYTLRQIVDRSILLWIQGTYGGVRAYRELQLGPNPLPPKTSVPTGISLWSFRNGPYPELADITALPRTWIERYVNLTHLTIEQSGGHFPAQSRPAAWIQDVRSFFGGLNRRP